MITITDMDDSLDTLVPTSDELLLNICEQKE